MGISGSTLAPTYARFGTARFGAARFGYFQPTVAITIGGVAAGTFSHRDTLDIEEVLTGSPNTATLTIRGGTVTPSQGQEIVIGLGSISNRIFAGHILKADLVMSRSTQKPVYQLQCNDYTWLLNAKRIRGRLWRQLSATQFVREIVEEFATGFSTRLISTVEVGLPIIDFATSPDETLWTALTRLADTIGGFAAVDYYKRVYLFQSVTRGAATAITDTNTRYWGFTKSTDVSQVATRVLALGASASTTAAVPIGSTSISVNDTTVFGTSGGTAIVDGNEVTYTGLSAATGPGDLTGVPASGAGSIIYDITDGATVMVMAVVDDSAGQTAIATLLGSGDGVIEGSISDSGWTDAAARTAASNRLDVVSSTGDESVTFRSRDQNYVPGRTVSITLTTPSTSGTYVIQRVRVSGFTKGLNGTAPNRFPIRDVEAGVVQQDVIDLIATLAQ